MGREEDEVRLDELELKVLAAFADAYPDIPTPDRNHMARNFTQVLHGIISIGEKLGAAGEVNHMDLANGLVYSCFYNTRLEELQSDECDGTGSCVTSEDMSEVLRECVSRVADWLLGVEVLRTTDPEQFENFVKGAVALGATGWERDRRKLDR